MKIMHLMRTYGTSGGENQLSQMFFVNTTWSKEEFFVFLYKDDDCKHLFEKNQPDLKTYNLIDRYNKPASKYMELLKLLKYFPFLFINLIKILIKEKPQLCISHGFQAAVLYWVFSLAYSKCKWVYFHRVKKEKKKVLIFKILFFPTKYLIANSLSVANSLSNFANKNKILTINNGISLELFDSRSAIKFRFHSFCPDNINLVSVGRLLPYKNQIMLVDVIKLLRETHTNIKLYIVGDGSHYEFIKNKINTLNLNETVFLLGEREDVPSILDSMDIFVNSSLWEGMSNSVLEAMASSLPSIVVDAPGVSECHLNYHTGLIVKNDYNDISNAIKFLLSQPKLMKEFGLNARKHIEEEFSIEKNRDLYIKLYEKLVV